MALIPQGYKSTNKEYLAKPHSKIFLYRNLESSLHRYLDP